MAYHQLKNKKVKWTQEEDELLTKGVNLYGIKNWNQISQIVQSRTSHQCRERWICIHDPSIRRNNFTYEEDLLLIHLHNICGNKWSIISNYIKGRSPIILKNRFNCLSKRGFILDPKDYIIVNIKNSKNKILNEDWEFDDSFTFNFCSLNENAFEDNFC